MNSFGVLLTSSRILPMFERNKFLDTDVIPSNDEKNEPVENFNRF